MTNLLYVMKKLSVKVSKLNIRNILGTVHVVCIDIRFIYYKNIMSLYMKQCKWANANEAVGRRYTLASVVKQFANIRPRPNPPASAANKEDIFFVIYDFTARLVNGSPL